MTRLKLMLFILLGFVNGSVNSQIANRSDSTKVKSIYKESVQSKFEILSENDDIGYTYKTVESNFKAVSIQLEKFDTRQYFAKFITTTKTSTSLEGQERNIKINIKSFDNPTETIVEINKNCDHIELQNHTYKVVKYGCCGNLNHYQIFDYENRKIIEGDDKIVTGFIPNSRLIIYASFTQNSNDSTTVGTLHYSTTNGNSFEIKIKSESKTLIKCDILANISFVTGNKIDEFDKNENEYTLWSLDRLENENFINNLTIEFNIYSNELECLDKKLKQFVSVPIINGKPFGKDNKRQEIMLD